METVEKRQFIDEFKTQWKSMWRNRVDDRVRAEGIADRDYTLLFIDRGTVLIATRKFKLLDFHETLQQHKVFADYEIASPNPSTGGWRKFSRTYLAEKKDGRRKVNGLRKSERKSTLQMKKGGRGWLHRKML